MLSKNDKEALHDVNDRISMLERRLDNARQAKDAFVQHLRGKYPNWRPPMPNLSYQEVENQKNRENNDFQANFSQLHREPLLSRLSTSNYQWDVEEMRRTPAKMPNIPNSQILDIPTSGPLLESDLRRSKIRLREISEELRALRMDRMSLSTEQWMQTEQFRQHKSLRLALSTDSPRQMDHLDEARSRLATMEFTENSPVETPTEERKLEMRFREEHEKMLEEMRNAPSVPAAPSAPIPSQVRFQEPVEPVSRATVIPETPVAAPAPPVAPVIEQKPEKPAVQSLLSNMFKFDDSDSDSEKSARAAKSAPSAPSTSKPVPGKPYDDSLLKNFIGQQDSDSDADNYFSSSRKKPSKPKTLMFQDFDDDDFFS